MKDKARKRLEELVETFPGTKAASFAAGADDFIAKPFIPTELLARVEAQLRRRPVR